MSWTEVLTKVFNDMLAPLDAAVMERLKKVRHLSLLPSPYLALVLDPIDYYPHLISARCRRHGTTEKGKKSTTVTWPLPSPCPRSYRLLTSSNLLSMLPSWND